ncbi:MAG: hypothetical protein AABM29_03800 [Actinomycetota bacterium]
MEGEPKRDDSKAGEPGAEDAAAGRPGAEDANDDAMSPLDRIVLVTERELAAIEQRAEAEAERMSGRTDRHVREMARDRRRQLILLRAELIDRVTALAIRFEGLLEVLDSADAELNRVIGDDENDFSDDQDGAENQIRVTVSERRRMTISHDLSDAPLPPTPMPQQSMAPEPRRVVPSEAPAAGDASEGRWSSWWRRFWRGAA